MRIEDAYRLADLICTSQARELALESRRYRRDPEQFFDPLTMVCLAELIYSVAENGWPKKTS